MEGVWAAPPTLLQISGERQEKLQYVHTFAQIQIVLLRSANAPKRKAVRDGARSVDTCVSLGV